MDLAICLENAKLMKAPPNPRTKAHKRSCWAMCPRKSIPKAGRTNSERTVKVIDNVTKIRTLANSNNPIPFNLVIEFLLLMENETVLSVLQ